MGNVPTAIYHVILNLSASQTPHENPILKVLRVVKQQSLSRKGLLDILSGVLRVQADT